ncbi:HTH domain-containing protein [Kamptonema sp. UHCC 0994]|uniref:HTH domain-containing protein n=1 Tax=Kamptonema sp. UHCC 0994 TaxID=3031329 RepID=UPI0023BB0675|nr:HTH domain-containing protein [Kamptonema sp. UHCC 0994]MDF0556373.1 HTH domain-containing protein [Kamptonema sp. UHCC 0994]
MHDDQREKICALAKTIYKFQSLEDSEKKWIKPLLSRGIVKTLEMLDLIEGNTLTFEEIADDLQIHPTTVTQRINALIEGGYPISLNGKTAIAATGRPRKLAKRIEEPRTPG